ncbi:MAG: AAA family ATPase [Anaerolineaceae bacterium]|nr:AAA family ATPase [Anaerolineaceae bacterium]
MAEGPQGITAITVGGYKSIRDEMTIEIRPLTILAGANSSGKSSIMQPMLMMKQTLEAPYDPGPLMLDGPHVKFTKFEQLLSQAKGSGSRTLAAGFKFGRYSKVLCVFGFCSKNGLRQRSIELSRMKVESRRRGNFELTPDLSYDEIIQLLPEASRKRMDEEDPGRIYLGWRIRNSRCFLQFDRLRVGGREDYLYSFDASDAVPDVKNSIANVVHVPGLRGNPERSYPVTNAEPPKFTGPFQHYAASLLLHWMEEGNEKFNRVETDLIQLDLTRWVKPVRIDDANVEIQVGRLPVATKTNPKDDLVSIADVGIGVSQVLPVLVSLRAAEPGQMVYIEQPELHLHPRAQVALADVLANAAKRGVRVVVETHSSLLLQGILTLIAREELDHEDVILNWFDRDKQGCTRVEKAKLDSNGAYGDWPEDFGDVELGIQGRYLDAVAKREFGS